MYGLSNGAIFNDLEQPLTEFLRSRYTLTLNVSETVKHTAIVTTQGEEETAPKLSNDTGQFEWSWVTSNPYFNSIQFISVAGS